MTPPLPAASQPSNATTAESPRSCGLRLNFASLPPQPAGQGLNQGLGDGDVAISPVRALDDVPEGAPDARAPEHLLGDRLDPRIVAKHEAILLGDFPGLAGPVLRLVEPPSERLLGQVQPELQHHGAVLHVGPLEAFDVPQPLVEPRLAAIPLQ